MKKALRPALAAVLVILAPAFMPGLAQDRRSYAGGNFFFQLDGVKCGFLASAEGGSVFAEVIKEPQGADYYVKKHIAQPKYEDFTLQLGFAMAKPVYDWIDASWKNNYMRKNGAIVAADYNLHAISQREFFNALITETTIPPCDNESKEPAYITLKFAPEYTRFSKASGNFAEFNNKNADQRWIPSNFKLDIPGLDCTKVNKIDAFTIKQNVPSNDLGDARDYLREPGKLDFPNLKITLAEISSESWAAWHEDFVIKGNNDESKEKGGTLTFLSPNREKELATISFFNMGVYSLTRSKEEANADKIKTVTVELYCERMEFKIHSKD